MKIKFCPRCKIKKLISEFCNCYSRKDGLQYECKKCRCIRDRQFYQKNKERLIQYAINYQKNHKNQKRNNDLKLKYGITLDNYNQILKKQNGVCAMCRTLPKEKHHRSKKSLPLAVDHNHKTGKVRGLLCRQCNQALGKYETHKDNILQYLRIT